MLHTALEVCSVCCSRGVVKSISLPKLPRSRIWYTKAATTTTRSLDPQLAPIDFKPGNQYSRLEKHNGAARHGMIWAMGLLASCMGAVERPRKAWSDTAG